MTKMRKIVSMMILAVVAQMTCDQIYQAMREDAQRNFVRCTTTAGSSGNWYGISGCYTLYAVDLGVAEAVWIGCKANQCLDQNCGGEAAETCSVE